MNAIVVGDNLQKNGGVGSIEIEIEIEIDFLRRIISQHNRPLRVGFKRGPCH